MKEQVKQLTKEDYNNLRLLSHVAKNLTNEVLYHTRQYYFQTGKGLKYKNNYQRLKSSENYNMLNSNMAQQIIKEVEEIQSNVDKNKALAIDFGVNNLATCVTSTGETFLVDGRKLKSINQWYNKENARLQSIKDKQAILSL